MDRNNTLQQLTSSSSLPALNTPEGIAAVRLDERRYPRYGGLGARQRQLFLSDQIQRLVAAARIRDINGEEVINQASALDEMIMKNEAISGLSIVEMTEAFKNGLFGVYGEFYGLSAPNLYGFLRSYLESEVKQASTAIVRKTFEQRKRDEMADRQRSIRAEIEEAKRNGSFVPTGRAWFQPKTVDDAIDSSEHANKVRAQAREILKNR